MKSLFNLWFDFAYAREIVDRNYARAFEISKEIRKQQAKDKRINAPFSDDEIQVLWGMLEEVKFVDMILITIYSGWRPQELATL